MRIFRFFPVLMAGVILTDTAKADVKMPAIFGDHMVLQQGINLPVWGKADPGEKVTVTVGGETGSATAAADGKWTVKLAPLKVSTTAVPMTVAGKNMLKFDDVLIGDVWLCSGQSNMEAGIGAGATELPMVRIFVVPERIALTPMDDFLTVPDTMPNARPFNPTRAHWQLATVQMLQQTGFTAAGFFFGQEIQKMTGQPLGLIGSYVGGTPIQSWSSIADLQHAPPFQAFLDSYKSVHDNYDKAMADYPAAAAAYPALRAKWDAEIGGPYGVVLNNWQNERMALEKQGKQIGTPYPKPSTEPPPAPVIPDGGPMTPTVLFNGMIAPLIPYGIKGVIWYQAESNNTDAGEYGELFTRMITDWRAKWGHGDFPFCFVQVAMFYAKSDRGFAILREQQAKGLTLPNTAMAIAFDIGNFLDVHPQDKLHVGLRLAEAAKHVAYGKDNVYSGPTYDKMEIKGNAVQVSFKNVGGGLIISANPQPVPGADPIPTDKLFGFAIAGADKKWVAADAKIDGSTVIVSSAEVPQPVAVQYAYDVAEGNFYNKEMLPAPPFHTNNWGDDQPYKIAAPPGK